MNAEQLLRELRRRRAYLWVDGDRVCWRAPKGLINERVLAVMRELKPGLLLLLESERLLRERGCSRCGRVPLRKAGQVCFWCQEREPGRAREPLPREQATCNRQPQVKVTCPGLERRS